MSPLWMARTRTVERTPPHPPICATPPLLMGASVSTRSSSPAHESKNEGGCSTHPHPATSFHSFQLTVCSMEGDTGPIRSAVPLSESSWTFQSSILLISHLTHLFVCQWHGLPM